MTIETGNKNIVLIVGEPSSGKSTSLMNMDTPERVAYLNADLKELPFRTKFGKNVVIPDPAAIIPTIAAIEESPDLDSGIIDTITFLMNMYEKQYINTSTDAFPWKHYANFYYDVIHAIKSGTKNYAVLAHVKKIMNDDEMVMETVVPVKGAIKAIGVEADFTTIIATKKVAIKKLEGFENSLLNITDNEIEDGFKYVFQTRIDKDSIGEKMRSAIGLWERKEKYIDNNIGSVFTRLNEYYN